MLDFLCFHKDMYRLCCYPYQHKFFKTIMDEKVGDQNTIFKKCGNNFKLIDNSLKLLENRKCTDFSSPTFL